MNAVLEKRDLIGGVLMALVGGGIALYSATNYGLGTARLMGAGLFPTALGVILATLGIIIALAGSRVRSPIAPFDARRFVIVLGSLGAFIFVARYFGMIPGLVVLVVASTFAVDRMSIASRLILTLVLVGIAVAVFHFFFALQLPLFRWPF